MQELGAFDTSCNTANMTTDLEFGHFMALGEYRNQPINAFFTVLAIALCFLWIGKKLSWRSHPLGSDPRSPPLVPYILPWIGSAFAFKRDVPAFMLYWSNRLKTSIFASYVGGKCFILITDPFAAAYILSRVPELVWDESKYKIMKNGVGQRSQAARRVAEDRNIHGIYEKHLFRSDNLSIVLSRYQEVLQGVLHPSLTNDDNSTEWKSLGILDFLGRAIYLSSAEAIFGYSSVATDDCFKLAMEFNKRFFMFITDDSNKSENKEKEAYSAREELVNKLKSVFSNSELPSKSKVPSKVGDIWSDLAMDLYENKKNDKNPDDQARNQLMGLVASYLNTIPALFWTFYHLLQDKSAYSAVKQEVISIYNTRSEAPSDGGGEGSKLRPKKDAFFSLADLHNMHNLDSLIMEAMRLETTQKSYRSRYAKEDFEIKLPVDGEERRFSVKRGTIFLSSDALQHRDEDIFKDASSFKWDRFVPGPNGEPPIFTKNGRRIIRPVNPFGGGLTVCPGRHFAVAEIKALIATLLLDYDVRFPGNIAPASAPAMMDTKSAGNSGMPAHDVLFEVRKNRSEGRL